MRQAMLIVLCVGLSGCAEYTDLSPDAFAHGKSSQEQFGIDSRACQQQAENQRSYQIRGIFADESDRHDIYSGVYSNCMTAMGYQRRTGWYNFWEGYDW
jgi:outer membrane biogenesis lipoprotein LolB